MKLTEQLAEEARIHELVGRAIHRWGLVDQTLFSGFCVLTEIEDYLLARLLFYRTIGTRQRAGLVGDVVLLKCPELKTQWRKISDQITGLLKARNAIAHNPVEYHSAVSRVPVHEDAELVDVIQFVKMGVPVSSKAFPENFSDLDLIDADLLERHSHDVFALMHAVRAFFRTVDSLMKTKRG